MPSRTRASARATRATARRSGCRRCRRPPRKRRGRRACCRSSSRSPRWEVTQPGNVLRVFERGGAEEGEIGNPTREEEPGRPGRQAERSRLRHAAAHRSRVPRPAENAAARSAAVVPRHERSARRLPRQRLHGLPRRLRQRPLAGALGAVCAVRQRRADADRRSDDLRRREPGHPIKHTFTRSIPSSQCMTCHMHPGTNMVTTYYGYTWWENETDGEVHVPGRAARTAARPIVSRRSRQRNPGAVGAAGLWSRCRIPADRSARRNSTRSSKHTQFADFHGHGWVFRAVYKRDRKGNLLDKRRHGSCPRRSARNSGRRCT